MPPRPAIHPDAAPRGTADPSPRALHRALTHALHALGRGLLKHPANTRLRAALVRGTLSPEAWLDELARSAYRLLFLCAAEDRRVDGVPILHPPDGSRAARTARAQYLEQASTAMLRRRAMDADGVRRRARRGASDGELWHRLGAVTGALSGEPEFEADRARWALPALGRGLWRLDGTAHVNPPNIGGTNGCELANADLLEAVGALMHLDRDAQDVGGRPIDFATIAPELLLGAHQGVMSLEPRVGGDGMAFELVSRAGRRRRAAGAFYTPPALVRHLLDTALEPTLDEAVANLAPRDAARAILRLRVCDPACGPGHVLLGAVRRMAHRLACVRAAARLPAGRARSHPAAAARGAAAAEPTACERREATRDVIAHCLYGVDLDPLAVELCAAALWLEAMGPNARPAWPVGHLACGNALLGAPRAEPSPHARAAADAWCVDAMREAPARRRIAVRRAGVMGLGTPRVARADDSTMAVPLFHWHVECPEVFAAGPQPARRASPRAKLTPTKVDDARAPGFDVVIGNPPFLNQLESATAVAREAAALLRRRFAGAVRGYADMATAFLLLSAELARPGGRIALVQPQALLAVKDASAARAALAHAGTLEGLWVSNARVFDGASVFTCVPTIRVAGPRRGVLRRWSGPEFDALAPIEINHDALAGEPTWAPLGACAAAVPDVHVPAGPTVGTLATATADFRDQYYGLRGFLVEDAALDRAARQRRGAFPSVVTTGLIDLAACRWGRAPTRLLKSAWAAPRIDRDAMRTRGTLSAWLDARLVPKAIVATQTRVLEVFVDARGELVPSTPLISVMPRKRRDLWRVAAAVASPVCAAVAMRRYAGAALSVDAIKLSAAQTLGLPLPVHRAAWDRAARLLRRAHAASSDAERLKLLQRFGPCACAAYGVSAAECDAVMEWWSARLAPRR